tara:strand:+ start:2194 stop:2391 length:198 start_codon:yes stop_codon:yes gene_type:complete
MITETGVEVELLGKDGNAFFILGTVKKALERAGYEAEEISEWHTEATAGDYNHLLRVVMETVVVL